MAPGGSDRPWAKAANSVTGTIFLPSHTRTRAGGAVEEPKTLGSTARLCTRPGIEEQQEGANHDEGGCKNPRKLGCTTPDDGKAVETARTREFQSRLPQQTVAEAGSPIRMICRKPNVQYEGFGDRREQKQRCDEKRWKCARSPIESEAESVLGEPGPRRLEIRFARGATERSVGPQKREGPMRTEH